MRDWYKVEVCECRESMISVPIEINRLMPHPYLSLGAPYGKGCNPWQLRIDVINRLTRSQNHLATRAPRLRIAMFDAWRPISVQEFMIKHTIEHQLRLKGISEKNTDYESQLRGVVLEVQKFWAPPSKNPQMPPPHSTGAALDITLADQDGIPLDMGGEIDQLGEISSPGYYSNNENIKGKMGLVYANRRKLLFEIMDLSGFVQHPNEWWHFSYGDQLWAWKKGIQKAIYGNYDGVSNSSVF